MHNCQAISTPHLEKVDNLTKSETFSLTIMNTQQTSQVDLGIINLQPEIIASVAY